MQLSFLQKEDKSHWENVPLSPPPKVFLLYIKTETLLSNQKGYRKSRSKVTMEKGILYQTGTVSVQYAKLAGRVTVPSSLFYPYTLFSGNFSYECPESVLTDPIQ